MSSAAATVTFAKIANSDRQSVLIDGVKVGEVFRATFTETKVERYSGKMYGSAKASTRTRWSWETADGMGDDDFGSRKAAVEDMLCFV